MSKLAILIVTYNAAENVRQCLRKLEPEAREHSVIACDNASSEPVAEMIRQEFPWVTLIENEGNLGFARGVNLCAGKCPEAEYYLLLNPDLFVETGIINMILEAMKKDSTIGCASCLQYDPNGKQQYPAMRFLTIPSCLSELCGLAFIDRRIRYYLYKKATGPVSVDVLRGSFLFVNRQALLDEPILDELFFMYGEDLDLCKRMLNNGYRALLFPNINVTHVLGASTSDASFTDKNMAVSTRLYLQKHLNPTAAYSAGILCATKFLLKTIIRIFRQPATAAYMTTAFQYAAEYVKPSTQHRRKQ